MRSHWYVVGSVANFLSLIVGIAIGFGLATWRLDRMKAFAQVVSQPKQEVEEISPVISGGTAAFATLLAGRLASDEVDSHGLDLLKLHENTLNLLATKPLYFSREELQGVIDRSRAPKVLTLKQPEKPKGKEKK